MVAGLAILPSAAQAGVGAGSTPTFPTDVIVGQTAVPVSVEVRNLDTPPEVANTVCNFGDTFPCPVDDPGITLIPSCGQLGVFSVCTPAGADPDVFGLPATGTGEAGTACAGMVFDITPIDPVFGQYRFTPQGGAHVVLPAPDSLCRIGFAVDVLKVPDVDLQPRAGVQTVQIVDNTQFSGFITASARGTSTGTTVSPNPCEPSAPGTCEHYGPGIARIAAVAPTTGCRSKPFRVFVRGTFIDRVLFTVDGARVGLRTAPNYRGDGYSVLIRPNRFKAGTHRIVARTRFAAVAKNRGKQLNLVVRLCG